MDQHKLDAVIVYGSTDTSKDLAYLTGGIHLENALYLHTRNSHPVLISSVLERENAQATGYTTKLWSEYPLGKYLQQAEGDVKRAQAAQWRDIFADHNVRGRVGFYGMLDMGYAWRFLNLLSEEADIQIAGDEYPTIFNTLRETKDAHEIEIMQQVGKSTTEVIANVFDFLGSHRSKQGILFKTDGSPLTIGDIKAFIRLELAKRNLEEVHENIFSQGRDAGIPHNSGRYDMPLELGKTIIFDIFPRDRGSGYFHDITRTFFLGYAPDDLAQRWAEVKHVFDVVMEKIQIGEPEGKFQQLTCHLFEEMGHPTICSNPQTTVGYIHSLGHGVGLDIHENPRLSTVGKQSILKPGHVISVEPGLYYPDDGWGIRIEDTIAFDADGQVINLSNFPYDMIIPVR